jgi:hypothetical protein
VDAWTGPAGVVDGYVFRPVVRGDHGLWREADRVDRVHERDLPTSEDLRAAT